MGVASFHWWLSSWSLKLSKKSWSLCDCPRALYNSFSCSDPVSQHKQWLNYIRSTVWENIEFEDELPPSWEALRRHWLHSCWVSHFWQQAGNNVYHLLDVNEIGWKVVDGYLEIEWDDPNNFEQVKERVRLLLRGCGCKKGCNNRRCSCFKAGGKCVLTVRSVYGSLKVSPISTVT